MAQLGASRIGICMHDVSCISCAVDELLLLLLQRAHELVGRQLPVTVAEVVPDLHRIRFNCIEALAAQRAALQPADLITGVVTEVRAAQATQLCNS